jgi:uncharacterized protein YacL
MLSIRTFWAIFTVTIILFVEFVVAQSALQWMLTEEILTRTDAYFIVHPDAILNAPNAEAEPKETATHPGVITHQQANTKPEQTPSHATAAPSQTDSTAHQGNTVSHVDKKLQKHGLVAAENSAASETANNSRYLTSSDLSGKRVQDLFLILYQVDPHRALLVTFVFLLIGALVGFLIASIAFRHLVSFGDSLNKLSLMDIIGGIIGTFIGILVSLVALSVLKLDPIPGLLVFLLIVGLSLWIMANMSRQLKYYFPGLARTQDFEKEFQKPKILDTNVIIDGRVADVCAAGFIEGRILVPSFVLDELQHIADSGDSLRRARGRRGLDILNQMRKDLGLQIKQYTAVNPANPEEVDARLVNLAKEIEGIIITNDFNLNKVAEVQGVDVMNINELANALKPVVLPGEELTVNVIKEGKEIHQGIAYLDDGTMIVIEGAKQHIGETIEVIVTSVLQTVAGKMIFANVKSLQAEEDAIIDRNLRNYSSIRPRRKTY